MRRLILLAPLMLAGCSGAEIAGAATAIGGAIMGYQKMRNPVGAAIVADPAAFWKVAAEIVGLVTLLVTLAAKAGRDGKKNGRYQH